MTRRHNHAPRMTRVSRACACRGGILAVTAYLLTACVGDKAVVPAVRPPDVTIGPLQVSPLNAVIAVGEVLPITVTAKSLSGNASVALDSIQYILQNPTDSLRVHVSASGQVTGVGRSDDGSPVRLQVMGYKDGLARADVVMLTIVEHAFPNATLSIQPIPPDSAILAAGSYKAVIPVIQSATTGESVSYPAIRFELGAGDSARIACYAPPLVPTATIPAAQLNLGLCAEGGNGYPDLDLLFGRTRGTGWVHANVTVFGVALHDSVQYQITNPLTGNVVLLVVNFGFTVNDGTNIEIAPGGIVSFLPYFNPGLGVSIGFTFDHPEAATAVDPPPVNGGASGNITPLTGTQSTVRQFLTPGVYTWTATAYGGVPPYTGATVTGKITVAR